MRGWLSPTDWPRYVKQANHAQTIINCIYYYITILLSNRFALSHTTDNCFNHLQKTDLMDFIQTWSGCWDPHGNTTTHKTWILHKMSPLMQSSSSLDRFHQQIQSTVPETAFLPYLERILTDESPPWPGPLCHSCRGTAEEFKDLRHTSCRDI